jgi:hypothetical protein
MTTIAVAGALAARAGSGGESWVRLSYALGLRRLGFDVRLVEEAPGVPADAVAYAETIAAEFALDYTLADDELEAADLLVNVSGNLRSPRLLERFHRRIYVDIDPGFTQIWHEQGLIDLAGHDAYFTIGENIGRRRCPVPQGGVAWRYTRPPVVLDDWPVTAPGFDRFTTVANWRAPFGAIEPYGLKHHEWRKMVSLPEASGLPFEAALAIDPADEADRHALEEHGWILADPSCAADPQSFRTYVQGSGAEFSVAQGIYVETESGWFSDRTVRYLASGKPALVQDTGSSVPAGEGLVSFRTLEEALAGARAIAEDYERHAAAARRLAEEFFDSAKVLTALLEEIPTRTLRPLGRVQEPALDSGETFCFAVSGESRPTVPGMPFSEITRRVFSELALIRPGFVLFTGDAVWGYGDSEAELVAEINRFRDLADGTGVPLYNAPGNHEMQSEQAAIATFREQSIDLYGSFDVGRWHFVCLNTDEWWRERRVCGEQLDWLRHDLERHAESAGIFVFMHRPLFSWFSDDFDPDDSEELQYLFEQHPVRAVFASHDHMFGLEVRDGVRYYTTGGGGAPLYAQPDRGGFAHYLLVTVGGDEVDYNVVEPFHLEYELLDGGTRVRLANTTDRDLLLRNVSLSAPRAGSYKLVCDFVDFARRHRPVRARIAEIEEHERGTSIRAEVEVPTGTSFYVTAESSR